MNLISKQIRIAILIALLLTTTVLGPASFAIQSVGKAGSPVTLEGTGDEQEADVPIETKWSKTSLSAAKIALARSVSLFQDELDSLQESGAVRVNKVFDPKAKISTNWKQYLPELRKYRLEGVDAFGNKVAHSHSFPLSGHSLASLLVGLSKESCTVVPFNFWNFSTWFLEDCKIAKPSAKAYLRVAVREAHLRLDLMPLNREIQYYWTQLDACLANGWEYALTKSHFDCPKNQRYMLGHRFALRSLTGLGGYEFKVYPSKNKATIRYLAPDYAEYAEGVTALSGTPNLKFRQPLVLEGGIVP